MDAVGTRELLDLTGEREGPCVSVYLPTHVVGEQVQQDPVRLRNLLQQAEEQLATDWMRAPEARRLVKAARDLPGDPIFWNDRSHGMAIFIAPDQLHRYRVPRKFEELVIVNRRFHVKPLLPLLTGGDRFFILALSQNKVQFFAASQYTIETVEVPELPSNMEEALNYVGADPGLQVHTAFRGNLGKQGAVFHGQGGQPDSRKEELAQFFRMIDSALQPLLRDEATPLLLASVEYLMPIYREVSGYAHIAEQALNGNCDYLSAHEIHQRAWPLMEPVFHQAREEAVAKYHRLAKTAKTSDDLREIVAASHSGRVEALFVDTRAIQWGQFDPQTTTVELRDTPQPGDEDLLDLAVVQTLVRRGAVHSVERDQVPSGGSIAAIYRY